MCRVIVSLFLVAYVLALALFLIGTFGLLGNERDPLSGVFLMPLGLPWILGLEWAPDKIRPWLAAATPAVNLAILYFGCRLLGTPKIPHN